MTKDGHDRIGVPMPHREPLLEVRDLLHVGKRSHLLELLHPVFNRLPILLLNRREIGRGAREFLLCHSLILFASRGGSQLWHVEDQGAAHRSP